MEHLTCQYFLNTDLRSDELQEQSRLLCEAGYEVVYLHARAGMKTPYLSRAWFEALKTVTGELSRHGVRFAIWDEDNYPSGTAGNRIVCDYPELAASQLKFTVFEGRSQTLCREFLTEGASFLRCFAVNKAGKITDISDCCGTLRSQWGEAYYAIDAYSPHGQLGLPHRRRRMNATRFAVEYCPAEDCRIVAVEVVRDVNSLHNSDLLNPETAERLLACTHDAYLKEFGGEFLKKWCASSFMDEPSPFGNFPWTRRFPEEFQRDHGYELLSRLPELFLNTDAEGAKLRYDYRRTLGRLLAENYLRIVREWCRKYGLLSIGHLSRSEWLSYSNLMWPNELRMLGEFDIPCGDPLGAGIGKVGSTAHHLGLKTVASAARLFGKAAAGADAFAVGGDTVSLRNLKFMLDYHLVCGITYFNVHGLDYTLEGERNDETPPSLFYQHSQWPHMKALLDYLKKRCAELTGEHCCTLELLYPAAALQSAVDYAGGPDADLHRLAEELLSHQRDFELIDEVTLTEQDPAGFAEQRPYFIVAYTVWLPADAAAFLERYAGCGGTLIVIGPVPRLIDRGGEPWHFAERCRCTDFLKAIPGPELSGEGSAAVLMRKIRRNGVERTFLFNRGSRAFAGSFDGKPLFIEPGGAGFADELVPPENPPASIKIDRWQLRFGPNSLPLSFWSYDGGKLDLFNAGTRPALDADSFSAYFLASRGVTVQLVVEEESLRHGKFYLNGTELSGFVKTDFRDCRSRACDLAEFLETGEEPILNEITCTGTKLSSPPFLTGCFQASFPQGYPSFAVLTAAPDIFEVTPSFDYRGLGYGTFSGTASASAVCTVPAAGTYRLAFDRISDSALLSVDGVSCGVRFAPPYEWVLELSAGKHEFLLEICNAPGNRDRMAGLPAGLSVSK